MQAASTLIVAREDFSIPGAARNITERKEQAIDEKQRFFNLLQQSRPDVVVLNLTVTKGQGVAAIREVRDYSRPSQGHRFQGITYRPDQASLAGPAGTLVPLEPLENDVFGYLVAHSWAVCSRIQLSECAYRDQSAAAPGSGGDILSRLRKKLELAGGPGAGKLLKTERRRGYALAADTVSVPFSELDCFYARR